MIYDQSNYQGQMTCGLNIEAQDKLIEVFVVCRFVLPPFFDDPEKSKNRCQNSFVYRTKKSMALATNGVSIHHPVTRAHPGCPSSQRKRQVCKSVRTSNRPRNTLKKRNFRIWNILEEGTICY